MKNIKNIDGKKLALVLFGQDEEGNDDVAVFTGTARLNESVVTFERPDIEPLELKDDWIDRIKPVSSDMKETLLDADYMVPLSIGKLSQEDDWSGFVETGLKWPK